MSLKPNVLEALRGRHRGAVLTPDDGGYDEARRIWNARFDKRPGAIARCSGVADVIATIDVAREHDLLLAVRSGGHDYAGNSVCDGGLVIDLSGLTGIRIDPARRRARVEPGVRLGALDREAQAFGLAIPGGTVSTVGVAGLTLGGGSGYLSRKYGLAADNLVSADVVTAGGEFLVASAEENSDLLWGLRGGGGNLGVVTSFEFRLHPVGPEILTAQIFYRLDDAPRVLRAYRDFMLDAPDALQCYAIFLRVPPIPDFPEELHGKVVLDLVMTWADGLDEGERVIAPLRQITEPALQIVAPQPYVTAQQAFDAGVPAGMRWISRANSFEALSDPVLDTAVDRVADMRGPFTMAYFSPEGGGAIGRAAPDATAYGAREAPFVFHVLAGWADAGEDAEVIGWVDDVHEAMAAYRVESLYVNILGDGEEERVASAYGRNHGRLAELKKKYDPGNLFRANHNVKPAA